MSTTENNPLVPLPTEEPPVSPVAPTVPRGIAPVWHTLLFMAGIILLSVEGARELSGKHGVGAESNRLMTYAQTVFSQLLMLGWVYLGLRLRKIPFRSLLGEFSMSVKSIFIDIGVATIFWFASLIVLGTLGITWTVIDALAHHRSLLSLNKGGPDASQQQAVHTLTTLVPTTGREVVAWILVCIFAGFAEEIIFRGYFQRQFTAWSRGAVIGGVLLSAAMFGAAHGYQGVRNMVLLSIFGALFSLLALLRRSLRPGMFAHAWHDLFAGLVLALLHWKHMI